MIECLRCGECCKHFCDGIYAVKEDLLRWNREMRFDILEKFEVLREDGWIRASTLVKSEILALPDEGFDLVNPKTGNAYRTQCPFLRKKTNKNEYYCRIHNTRPWLCSEYQPWEGDGDKTDCDHPCPLSNKPV